MVTGQQQYGAEMTEPTLQHQLDEVRALLARAQALFGTELLDPPEEVIPDPGAVQSWLR